LLTATSGINVPSGSFYQYAGVNFIWQQPATYSTYLGSGAGRSAETGDFNIGLGNTVLQHVTSGSSNVAIDYGSGNAITTGGQNVGVGVTTLGAVTTGYNNVAIGYAVGSVNLVSGHNNILIGTSSTVDTPAAGSSSEIDIGGLLFYNSNSTAAPAVTSCGTSPSIDSHANNRSGTVTVGSGTIATCTVTFAGTGYSTWDHCRVTTESSEAAFAYSYTLTALTVTATSLTSDQLDYDCDGY
jgi:hypothetical protein